MSTLGQSILTFRSNAQIVKDEAAEAERQEALKAQSRPEVIGLSAYVDKCWSEAYLAKENGIRQRLDAAMLARQGQYSPEKLAELKATNQAETYIRVTATKCRIASGWLKDVYLGESDRPWTLAPTPIPDLPLEVESLAEMLLMSQIEEELNLGLLPDALQQAARFGELKDKLTELVKEEAEARARRAEDKIDDQLMEGGFVDQFRKFIDDFVLFPAAILKGPIIRRRPKRAYERDMNTGAMTLVATEDFTYEVERVSPYDIYPSPNAENTQDGYLFEHMRMRPVDLEAFRDVPGYNRAAIDEVLLNPGGFRNWTFDSVSTTKNAAEGRIGLGSTTAEGLVDVLEFHGWVGGKLLREWGATWVEDEAKQYNVCMWKCGHLILKAQKNTDVIGRRPYWKCSYEEIPGAFWGNGLADILTDTQQICNAAIRSLVSNMGMASGPQVMVDTAFLPPGEKLTSLTPWKVWKMHSTGLQGTQKLMDFFQPNSNANELIQVFTHFYNLADDVASLPRYMGGASTTASRTASGLSMLMDAGGKGMKQAAMNIDSALTGIIEGYYDLNQTYEPDPESAGDLKVMARGATRLMQKAQLAQRRNEMLMTTANPFDMEIMGRDGRAYLLREQARSLEMNPDKLVPTVSDLRAKDAMQQMAQQMMPQMGAPGQMPAPDEGATLEDGRPVDNLFPGG